MASRILVSDYVRNLVEREQPLQMVQLENEAEGF